ncbi:hypothetical protein [Nocardiopsis sp. LOL_012]|uniref:hypothetical protein n=1 Tax=Nocardiopsis sp. LOL_012 TaxID=3345409 RepID=UPI003A87B061
MGPVKGRRPPGASCTDGEPTSWRSVIDVDLVGVIGGLSKPIATTENICCQY